MKKLTYIFSLILSALLLFPSVAAAQTVEELMEEGRNAFLRYDFDEATRLYGLAKKKAKKNIPENLAELEEEVTLGENFMDRVEKLVILDSIAVPREGFFKNYRLPISSGYLADGSSLPFMKSKVDYVFSNESSDYKLWAEQDTTGNLVLMESNLLTDGNWQSPVQLPEVLNDGGNAAYPFMMPDGVTLYYASDNENSLGGYDIFVATRDASDGSFLQPQNIGMPYNSPYDDYLLAIDEYNGIGWWATDRNQLDDQITIYVFKTNDIRKNYDVADTEDLPQRAFITDYKATWDGEDYSSYLEVIDNITSEPTERRIDFIFPLSNGRIYYTLDDFQTNGGRTMMKKYLAAKENFNRNQMKLEALRKKYHTSHSSSLISQIRSLEPQVEAERAQLAKLLSEVHRAERN